MFFSTPKPEPRRETMFMSGAARFATFLILFLSLTKPALATLPEGEPAPEFAAPGALDGKVVRYALKDALKEGAVVVYFYPSAFTNGCNVQAHEFAVRQAEFKAAGASVVGVSLDNVERLQAFSADPDFCAGKLTVVSDADGSIARSYGISVREALPGRKDTRGAPIDHGFAERTTFVIGRNGRIAAIIGGIGPAANVEQTLKAVRELP
ncbi:MAG: peroxiredoxin [Zoogloeaceae bacterium]|jgi:peroxiredoxin|nr:peroxiredoxin [Zoogloeaceae bacterium]